MLDNQIVRRHNRFRSGPLATGQDMSESGLPLADQLQDRVRVVQGKWAMLMKEAAKKRAALEFECNVAVISKEKSDVPMSVTGEKTDPFLAMLPRDQVGIWGLMRLRKTALKVDLEGNIKNFIARRGLSTLRLLKYASRWK